MATKTSERAVVVGTAGFGLYFGYVSATDKEIVEAKAVRVRDCRHIRYWYGRTGGITSLAAFGPCGPRVKQNRIGAPSPSALITDVRNVYDCTDEAVQAFARIETSDGA